MRVSCSTETPIGRGLCAETVMAEIDQMVRLAIASSDSGR
jgi:hypothetical protein